MSLPGPLVCVVGPTASGKSTLSELVAVGLDTSIVSIDAMQVYRGMDVGTAKASVSERIRPLLMVDVADVTDDYSARLFQRDARACVDELLACRKTPVLCGGTGLYLNATIDEMEFPAGTIGGEGRSRYERYASEHGAEALHALLAGHDPASAALIHPNNVRRCVRALEMLDEGIGYADHHEGLHQRDGHYEAMIWGLTMDRARLYARIDARVDRMVEKGLVDEVRSLCECGLESSNTASQAIGYKEVIAALHGETTIAEAIDQVKLRTRRYAKRQLSWFRHDGRVRWIDLDQVCIEDAAGMIVSSVLSREESLG